MFNSLNRITRKQHAVIQVAHTAALPGTFWFQLTLIIYIFITFGSAGTTDHGGRVVLARLNRLLTLHAFEQKLWRRSSDPVVFPELQKKNKTCKLSNLVLSQYKSGTTPTQLYLDEITRSCVISCNLRGSLFASVKERTSSQMQSKLPCK